MTTTATKRWRADLTIENWFKKENLLEEHDFAFEASVSISNLLVKESLANNARIGDALDPELVATYVKAMKNGDVFPAIVIYRDGTILVGNHRVFQAG